MRWIVGETLPTTVALLTVNALGCAAIGALKDSEGRRKLLLGAGFCGGLTTLSGAALAVATDIDAGQWASGLALAAGVVLVAVAGFGLGVTSARLAQRGTE